MIIDGYLRERLLELRDAGLLRQPDAAVPDSAQIDACSNDYLGLARASVSRETEPLGAGASRLVHGTAGTHLMLERELASWLGTESALLFSSGYAANVGLLSALFSKGGALISDQTNHASIIDGCRLSRAKVAVVPHLALPALEAALREHEGAEPLGVVLESYFSMDGDGPDLIAARALCDRHRAFLIVDEAHALGVFGTEGRGRCSEAGIRADALVGGLGKAIGGQGGFVAGSQVLRDFLWNSARSFVFSTATSPRVAQGLLNQLREVRRADRARARLLENCSALRQRLSTAGLELASGSFGPIVPVIVGSNERATAVSARLSTLGVRAQAIRPPTVPNGQARIRLTVKSWFDTRTIEQVATATVTACRA